MSNHKCYNCAHFNGYYVKTYCNYSCTESGYCHIQRQVKNKNDIGCEKWFGRVHNDKLKRRTIADGMGAAVAKIEAVYRYMLEED